MELGKYSGNESNRYGEVPQAEAQEFGEFIVGIWRNPEVQQLIENEPLDRRGFTAGITVSDLEGKTITIQQAIPPAEIMALQRGPLHDNFFEIHVHQDTPTDSEVVIRLDQRFLVREGEIALQEAIVDHGGNTQAVPLEPFQDALRILKEGIVIDTSLEEIVPKHYLTGKEAGYFQTFVTQLWEHNKMHAVEEDGHEEVATGAGEFDVMLMQRADTPIKALICGPQDIRAFLYNETVTFWRATRDNNPSAAEYHALTRSEQHALLTELQRAFLIFPE